MMQENQWTGENRRKRKELHRILVQYRVLSLLVMAWAATVIERCYRWMESVPFEHMNIEHASIIGVVIAPMVGLFKFAFDFALDGKINNN